jgi:hypothetical protein
MPSNDRGPGYFAQLLSDLEKSPKASDLNVADSLFKHGNRTIWAARDSIGRPCILVPVTDNEVIENHAISKGLKASLRTFASGSIKGSYLVLECTSASADDIFGVICNDICHTIGSENLSTNSLLVTANEIIQKWREILASIIPDEPSSGEKIGLFGELLMLVILSKKFGLRAIEGWFGQEKTRHDFEFELAAIEVKTTTSINSKSINIHGFNQLEKAPGSDLFLTLVRLDRVEKGHTVASLIVELIELGYSLMKLDQKLKSFGDNVATDIPKWASRDNFKIVDLNHFYVDEEFPRIRFSELNESLQARLTGLEYKINVEGLDHNLVKGENTDELSENYAITI